MFLSILWFLSHDNYSLRFTFLTSPSTLLMAVPSDPINVSPIVDQLSALEPAASKRLDERTRKQALAVANSIVAALEKPEEVVMRYADDVRVPERGLPSRKPRWRTAEGEAISARELAEKAGAQLLLVVGKVCFLGGSTMAAKVDSQHKKVWADWFPVEKELIFAFSVEPDDVLLVDAEGENGHDLELFLALFPQANGHLVLQDLPGTIDNLTGLNEGVRAMAHDFFTIRPIKGELKPDFSALTVI
ncbi:hypothetical protein MMC13_001157 [Lambiella insularis]|nr:hypothetical protein [Lambiella insularis]